MNEQFLQDHEMTDDSMHFEEAAEEPDVSPEVVEKESQSVFVGSSLYVFYRYYQVRATGWCERQILYERLLTVARLCVDAANHKGEFQVSNTSEGSERE